MNDFKQMTFHTSSIYVELLVILIYAFNILFS